MGLRTYIPKTNNWVEGALFATGVIKCESHGNCESHGWEIEWVGVILTVDWEGVKQCFFAQVCFDLEENSARIKSFWGICLIMLN